MTVSVTVFKNLWDTNTSLAIHHCRWQDFVSMLKDCSRIPVEKKSDAKLISPAIYQSGHTRCNNSVLAWGGWAALDIDDVQNPDTFEDTVHEMTSGLDFVCYSTASSTLETPKYRIVFHLDSHVAHDQIRPLWWALNTQFGQMGDRQCKDLSRMYYLPATYKGAYNFFFTGRGSPINHNELIGQHPIPPELASGFNNTGPRSSFIDRLPPRVKKLVMHNRHNQMIENQCQGQTNTEFQWTGYQDCPFINKKLLDEYRQIAFQDNTGRYHFVYRIMASIASNAIYRGYPISTNEIVDLIREIDADTSNRYKKRSLHVEADRAIEFAYRNINL